MPLQGGRRRTPGRLHENWIAASATPRGSRLARRDPSCATKTWWLGSPGPQEFIGIVGPFPQEHAGRVRGVHARPRCATALRGGKVMPLEPKVLELLGLLLERRPDAVGKREPCGSQRLGNHAGVRA